MRWWMWILSIPKEVNPVLDTKSVSIDPLGHPHPDVVFLPGNLGGISTRAYEIKGGFSIFFPIINFITSFNEEPELNDDEALIERARSDMDDITRKEVLIDGQYLESVDQYRVSVNPFDLRLIDGNIFQIQPGLTRAVSDGYWIFLKPLTEGNHSIRTIGSCSEGRTCVDLRFEIIVKNQLFSRV